MAQRTIVECDLCEECMARQLTIFIEALPAAGRVALVRSVVIGGRLMERERIFRGM